MKKTGILLIVVAIILAVFSSPGFALLKKNYAALKGKITRVDAAKNEITVNDSSTGKETTFYVKRGVNPSLQVGVNVAIIFKIGTNVATNVTPTRRQ